MRAGPKIHGTDVLQNSENEKWHDLVRKLGTETG